VGAVLLVRMGMRVLVTDIEVLIFTRFIRSITTTNTGNVMVMLVRMFSFSFSRHFEGTGSE